MCDHYDAAEVDHEPTHAGCGKSTAGGQVRVHTGPWCFAKHAPEEGYRSSHEWEAMPQLIKDESALGTIGIILVVLLVLVLMGVIGFTVF